jgi:hypothetical protein
MNADKNKTLPPTDTDFGSVLSALIRGKSFLQSVFIRGEVLQFGFFGNFANFGNCNAPSSSRCYNHLHGGKAAAHPLDGECAL